MKTIFTRLSILFMVLLGSFAAFATQVFTIQNSPYTITTPMSYYDSVYIEPGVVFLFGPSGKMSFHGSVLADGSSDGGIMFRAVDTTGWSNNQVQNGGWSGLEFVGERAILNYCTIRDIKKPYNQSATTYGFFVESKMVMDNCKIYHNNCNNQRFIFQNSARNFEMNRCEFYENQSTYLISTHYSESTFTNCNFHHNLSDNYSFYPVYSVIDNDSRKTTIRGNTFYKNQSSGNSVVTCTGGNGLIEGNLIANNSNTGPSQQCGSNDGGAALFLTVFSNHSDTLDYLVRNNVIANNYNRNGHGTVYIAHAKVAFNNNTLVNNLVAVDGSGLFVFSNGLNLSLTKVTAKNNIFSGNKTESTFQQTIGIWGTNDIRLERNTFKSSISQEVYYNYTTLPADTPNNMMTNSVDFVNPTTAAGIVYDALQKDFSLQDQSVCVNRGVATGTYTGAYDFMGNNRVVDIVDIGAYENQTATFTGIGDMALTKKVLQLYPNPCTNYVTINNVQQGKTLLVWDIMGHLVYKQEHIKEASVNINTSHFANGNYYVDLSSGNTIYRNVLTVAH
ncbi:right-handed parallel beta-helix repeat-containing protein [Edaphocola aurantiacus]|uniref:right-handed parallel beta-helix repeat-containing protein n=1 Tax=Edaphocola aurantiacus TaxID=2601682 RepID=UPI001C93E575|nr:T9SS type A sorting domain-containing protein [Edaphocola aurantiacus]